MAQYLNTAEGGVEGVKVSGTNSGGASGDAVSVSIPAGSNITTAAAAAITGSMGYKVETTVANVSAYMAITGLPVASRWVFSTEFILPVSPPAAGSIQIMRSKGPSAGGCSLEVTTAGKLQAKNKGGSSITSTLFTTTLVGGTAYRVEMGVSPGATATSGVVDVGLFTLSGTTPLETKSGTGADLDGISGPHSAIRWGQVQGSGWLGIAYFDNLRAKDLASGWMGPVGLVPPTLSTVGSLQYMIDASASTPGAGGALSYSITQTSGPATTPRLVDPGVWAVEQDATAALVYAVTVIEASGTSDTKNVTVPQVSNGGAELVYDGAGNWG